MDEVREYVGQDGVVVEWRAGLCSHSGNCVRGLPAVFDVDRRPWIVATAASAEDVVAQVAKCPSGALKIKPAGSAPRARP